jgi:hypothetical protein
MRKEQSPQPPKQPKAEFVYKKTRHERGKRDSYAVRIPGPKEEKK